MWLKKNGFTNIRTLTRAPLVALRMLQNGRGDAWLANTTVAEYSSLFDENIRGKLVYGPPVLKSTSYIAFTKNFPTNIIEKYKKAYAEIKSDGTYDEIMEKYMKRSVETLNNR
jgi:ABC-type amino acid transport substrate-binding protein